MQPAKIRGNFEMGMALFLLKINEDKNIQNGTRSILDE